VTGTPTERGSGDHRWCDARIAALEAENARLQARVEATEGENALLRSRVGELESKVDSLMRRVEELGRRTRQNSQNSGRPPSSDGPAAPKREKKPPSVRKQGGQPGHEPHVRPLLPDDRVNEVQDHRPEACGGCGGPLEETDNAPRKLQVVEPPPDIQPFVTEHRFHEGWCPKCEKSTEAQHPVGVPLGPRCDAVTLGPHARALLALCTGKYRMSKDMVAEFFHDVLHIDFCPASVCGAEEFVSDAVEKPVEEAHAYVQEQPSVNVDETGFRQQRKKAWLWVAVTPLVTVFLVHLKRGRAAARELLGAFAGTLGSDRWCAYSYWVIEMRQLCWAHLLRHFQAFSESRGASRRIGLALLDEVHQMFHWWHKVRDGTLKRSTFKRYMAPLKRRVEALLTEAAQCRQKWTAATAREVLKLKDALWTFVSTEGVEPTNNAAERALRPAVIWRKVSFGTQSDRGSRFVERIMTVAATLKQQDRNVLDYLTAACIAKLRHEEPPSLLPAEVRPVRLRA